MVLTSPRAYRKKAVILAALLGGTLMLSACAAATPAPEATHKLVSSAPAASGPVDSIVWNLPTGEPPTIDPPNAATLSGAGVVSNLCDTLLTHDKNYNLESNLASFKQTSPTSIVYTIRHDAKFWDGSPVTADDVVYSLKRSAEPAQLVSFIYANVASIIATAPDQVTVTFTKPDELFNVEMTTFAGMVVKQAFAEAAGANFGTSTGGLMCSGPFKFDSWVPGSSITISRNDDYWNAKRRPLARQVKFTFVTDVAAYTQAMKTGEIDGSYEISPSAIPALQKNGSGALYLGPSMQSVSFNVARPDGPLSDRKIREALALSIDRKGIAKVVYDGAATPNYTYVAPATWQNQAKSIYAKAYKPFEAARTYDPKAAAKLVKGSDYDGSQIVLAIAAGDETASQVAQLTQQEAKQAGLSIRIQTMQPSEFAQAQYDPTKRVGVDLFFTSGFNGVQDPLEPLGFSYLPGAFYNLTGYDNADVTALIGKMGESFDPKERAELFVKAQTIYEKDLSVIPVASTNTVTFLNKRLAGAVTSFAYLTMPSLVYVGSSK